MWVEIIAIFGSGDRKKVEFSGSSVEIISQLGTIKQERFAIDGWHIPLEDVVSIRVGDHLFIKDE